MPRKVRELIRDLERAGFEHKSTKGDHRKYERGGQVVIISGALGDDAQRYQEKAIQNAIQ
ncbi:addiction module toxin, HicA family [Deinococcus sp. HMF7620]|uniref:Addiction module toxin, HicA family n=1 Tax=Deinococcus arboris TaxID=2682977 RepID=A0A7C9HRK6_9DEIO|nr:addiction module toxin, HicA family [Deinococcus arboris]